MEGRACRSERCDAVTVIAQVRGTREIVRPLDTTISPLHDNPHTTYHAVTTLIPKTYATSHRVVTTSTLKTGHSKRNHPVDTRKCFPVSDHPKNFHGSNGRTWNSDSAVHIKN